MRNILILLLTLGIIYLIWWSMKKPVAITNPVNNSSQINPHQKLIFDKDGNAIVISAP